MMYFMPNMYQAKNKYLQAKHNVHSHINTAANDGL